MFCDDDTLRVVLAILIVPKYRHRKELWGHGWRLHALEQVFDGFVNWEVEFLLRS
jgi:hypothetical protein